ncbi:MAG: hypothetical protein M3124_01155 [Actinomycetota bacterium]|nr:hypothetical protein [Actinomycetota bacterium]
MESPVGADDALDAMLGISAASTAAATMTGLRRVVQSLESESCRGLKQRALSRRQRFAG